MHGAVSRAVLARTFVEEALERAVDELHIHRDVDRATEVAVNRMAGYQHRLLRDKGRTPRHGSCEKTPLHRGAISLGGHGCRGVGD